MGCCSDYGLNNLLNSNTKNPLGAVIFGIVLFFASFAVLYHNEGRFDFSILAKKAVIVNPAFVDSSQNTKLVAVTGTMNSNEIVGDTYLKRGKYIAVKRLTEMYSWKEEKHSDNNNNNNNNNSNDVYYTYSKVWTQSPDTTSDNQHYNPPKEIENTENRVNNAKIGAYYISMPEVQLSNYSPLTLNRKNIILTNGVMFYDAFLYKGRGTLYSPQIGDIRIKYQAVLPNTLSTVLGMLANGKIITFTDYKGHSLFRVFRGTKESAVETLHNEYTVILWVLRAVGFIMMFFGLTAIISPLIQVLNFVPLLGDLTSMGLSAICLAVSCVLTLLTIILSKIVHDPIFMVLFFVLAGIVIWYFSPEEGDFSSRKNQGWS